MQARFRLPIKKAAKVKKPKKLQTSQESFHVQLKNYLFPTDIPEPPVTLVNYLLDLILQHHKTGNLNDSNNDSLALSYFSYKKIRSSKVDRLTANPWIAFRSYYSRNFLISYFQQNDISTILSEYWANNASARDAWTMFSKRYEEENKKKVKAGILVDDFKTWLNKKFGYVADYSPLDNVIQTKLELISMQNSVVVNDLPAENEATRIESPRILVEDIYMNEALLENVSESSQIVLLGETEELCSEPVFRFETPLKNNQNMFEPLN